MYRNCCSRQSKTHLSSANQRVAIEGMTMNVVQGHVQYGIHCSQCYRHVEMCYSPQIKLSAAKEPDAAIKGGISHKTIGNPCASLENTIPTLPISNVTSVQRTNLMCHLFIYRCKKNVSSVVSSWLKVLVVVPEKGPVFLVDRLAALLHGATQVGAAACEHAHHRRHLE